MNQAGSKNVKRLKWTVAFSGLMFLFILLADCLVLVSGPHPSFETVKNSRTVSDALLLDRNGKPLHEIRVNHRIRRMDWIGIDNISPALIRSVLESEDRRFYSHSGVDWAAMAHALFQTLTGKVRRGASTITMQTAGIVHPALMAGKAGRSVIQKGSQILSALAMERMWSKNEILEAYLNLISFRGELQGVAAASLGLFGKLPDGLDQTESLVLAALIRAPNAPEPAVTGRAMNLRNRLSPTVTDTDLKQCCRKVLSDGYRIRPRIAMAPHLANRLAGSRTRIRTTLDADLQQQVSDCLKKHIAGLTRRNLHDGAALVLDNRSGDVLAYVGGTDERSSARHVDGVRARRQAGSTLKPFLYTLALERKLLTAASLLEDAPLNVPTPTGIYAPRNYDQDFQGLVSVRTALSASLNTPAVRTVMLAGVEAMAALLHDLGFTHLNLGDFYGPSLALGSADVNLLELTNAYRTLANRGVFTPPFPVGKEDRPEPRRVMDENAVFIISDILSDRGARSVTFGLENPLATRFWTAVKTGTSKDMRDNWCVGYSRHYTVGVWVGNFSGEPMWNVSGISGAAPVWLETMNFLHRSLPSRSPDPPDGVTSRRIAYQGEIEPARTEWFLSGTETDKISLDTDLTDGKITYPADGAILALDPDIPENHQMVLFSAVPESRKWTWVVNGIDIASDTATVRWKTRSGRHILNLLDGARQVVDAVTFEVRGP